MTNSGVPPTGQSVHVQVVSSLFLPAKYALPVGDTQASCSSLLPTWLSLHVLPSYSNSVPFLPTAITLPSLLQPDTPNRSSDADDAMTQDDPSNT